MVIQEVKMDKSLSVIIVTYNSSEVIMRCLASFSTNKYDVYIVDNNSTDTTVKLVKEKFTDVNIITNKTNIGFGRANNVVLNKITTKYALILNPDADIDDFNIEICLNRLESNNQIALASPRIASNYKEKETKNSQKAVIEYTNFIVGGVLFLNMKNMKNIGFFDERYFMFAEDCDLSDRSIKNGFKNAIFNDACAVHQGGNSSKKTLTNTYRRFWHLGWSKSQYKKQRKSAFSYYRCTARIFLLYFLEGLFFIILFNREGVVQKFGFSFGCLSNLLGLKAFDGEGNPRPRYIK